MRRFFAFPPPAWAGAATGPGGDLSPWFYAGRGHRGHGHRHEPRDLRDAWAGFGGRWPGENRRARRGDVRAAVLALLAERPMHGYEIIQELSARTQGAWRPSPGSVYPTLQMLEDAGLVRGHDVEGKRVCSLTELGQAELADVRQRLGDEPWEKVFDVDASGPRHHLKESAFQLAAAVMQVARAGDPVQTAKVDEILRDARKKIYGILAEDA
jgi:DNA-binding PadR family transcriptional regulator